MKRTRFTTLLILLWVSTLYLPLSDAQDATTSELPDRPKLRLHGGKVVTSIAFSPNGKTLASVSRDEKTIRLWDVATGVLKHTLPGDAFVAFSPDGQTLATGGYDGTIRLWDANSGERHRTRTGHVGWVYSAAFSPDGNTLASVSSNGHEPVHIHVWDANSGERRRTLTGHTHRVYSVAFSPDGNTIASGDLGGTIRLWDANNGEPLQTLTGQNIVLSVAFSPDGKTIASGGTRLPIHLWDANTGRPLPLRPLTGHTSKVNSIAFSPDGKILASAGDDGTIRLWDWDANSGEPLQTLTGDTGWVYSVAFSPDGKTIASGSWDGTVLLWEITPKSSPPPVIEQNATTWGLPNGAKARIGKGTILDMQYTPDGKSLKVSSSIGSWLYDAETYQEVGMRALPQTINGGRYWSITPHVAISPDGLTSAVEGADRTIYLSDIETNTRLHTIVNPIAPKQRDDPLSFSPDGKTLVTISDYRLYLWDVETGSIRHTVTERYNSGTNYSQRFNKKLYCFSPDSAILALFTFADIRLWDVETGSIRHNFGQGYNYNLSMSFSPDGKTFAAAGIDGNVGNQIRFWDVETGTFLRSIEVDRFFARTSVHAPSDEHVISMAFSPDGERFAAAHGGGHISLWSALSGPPLRVIDEVTNSIAPSIAIRLVFSRDGKTLAGHMEDGTLRLWNVETATHFHTIEYMPLWINSMSFSPDGKTFAIGSGLHTGFVSLWDTETGTLLRSFTVGEGATATTAVVSVAFSPDGNTLATGARDNTLLLWDVKTGSLLRSFPPQVNTPGINAISFSPDGKMLATGYYKRALLWNVETSTPTCFFGHTDTVYLTAFSPDGKMLATGYGAVYGGINILNTKECTYHSGFNLLAYGRARPKSIAFGPDSKTLRFLNESGAYLRDLERNASAVLLDYKKESEYAAGWHLKTGAFSPDGKTMAIGTQASESETGNFEGRMHLWDVNTKTRLSTFEDVPVWTLAFTPDSTTLASEGGDGTVLLWEITPTSPEPERLAPAFRPKETALLPNYPNPFNPETWIPYQLTEPADVSLTIYDINGHVVRSLDFGHQRAGIYQTRTRAAHWDGRNELGEPVASGVYFYTLTAGDFTATRKMLIRK